MEFPSRTLLGRTGLSVSKIGLASSYGLDEDGVLEGFDRGINYFYWGSARRDSFGRGVKRLAARARSEIVTVVQSYTRIAAMMEPSLDAALRELEIGYTDVLLLGWWYDLPPRHILDAARRLQALGKVKHLALSGHHRPSFQKFIANEDIGLVMLRYNAAHPGGEREVFPHLIAREEAGRTVPGLVAYTATRWGTLLDPKFMPEGESAPRPSDCYRFALSSPHVNVVLAGPKNREELAEALTALDRGPLDVEEDARMRKIGARVRDLHSAGNDLFRFNPMPIIDRVQSRLFRER